MLKMPANDLGEHPRLRRFRETIESRSKTHPRYKWLQGYLQQDPNFEDRIYPFVPGRTRTMVVDFFSNSTTPLTISCPTNLDDINKVLSTRSLQAAVRLILVVATSGVDKEVREQQLSGTSRALFSRKGVDPDHLAPHVTRARTAGDPASIQHPIRGHSSYLPDPQVLSCIAAATQVDPEILLRHLDPQEHLVYRPDSWMKRRVKGNQDHGDWLDISLGVDQQNYITAAMHTNSTRRSDHRHTLLLLANEDNCLGIDFNKYASPLDQPSWSSDGTPHESFEARLRSKVNEQRTDVLDDPLSLIWDYTAGLSRSLSCQLELYQRKWKCLYEQHANSSATYGDSTSRGYVRKEATQLSTQIQYLHHSLSRLRQIVSEPRLRTTRSQEPGGNEIVRDFEQMSKLLESLKSAYDIFIEQQVGKISLQETRQSMTEARDLQRLSYLGFVFAPLSLASSFFSINIQPLGGPASLWSFVVTSMSILCLSIFVLFSLNGRVHRVVLEASTSVGSFLSSLYGRYQEPGLPHTEIMGKPPGFQKLDFAPGHVHLDGQGDMTGWTAAPHLSTWAKPPKLTMALSPRINLNDSESSRQEREQQPESQVSYPHRPPVREEYADPPIRIAIPEVISSAAQTPLGQSIRRRGTSSSSSDMSRSIGNLELPNKTQFVQRDLGNARAKPPTHESSTESTDNDDEVDSVVEHGQQAMRNNREEQVYWDYYDNAMSMRLMWSRSHPNSEYWDPGRQEVEMAMRLQRLCTEQDVAGVEKEVAEINRIPSDSSPARSNIKTDIVYGEAMKAAAGSSLVDALPILFNAMGDVKVRVECLSEALNVAIGDSEVQLATMRWLGNKGTELQIWNESPRLGQKLLGTASMNGHPEATRLLLDLGADPNNPTRIKSLPLQWAAQRGHLNIAKDLLEAGAYARDPEAMQEAAAHGHLHIIKALLAAGATASGPDFDRPPQDPFCLAARGGHWDTMSYLLELGIQLDEKFVSNPRHDGRAIQGKTRGEVAMERAAESTEDSAEAICLQLLDRGVKPEFAFYDEDRPSELTASVVYIHAVVANRVELLRRILDTGTDSNAIGSLDHGFDRDWVTTCGNGMSREDARSRSMLTLACGAGRIEAATMLLQHGANISYGIRAGGQSQQLTPLHLAEKYGHSEVVDLLLAHGADIHARASDEGIMPIHVAARAGRVDYTRHLLERGAELEGRDNQWHTPLILAARAGEQGTVEQLLDQGAAVSAMDVEGWTAAHHAAWNGHELVVNLLGARGADLEAQTREGFRVHELLLSYATREARSSRVSESG